MLTVARGSEMVQLPTEVGFRRHAGLRDQAAAEVFATALLAGRSGAGGYEARRSGVITANLKAFGKIFRGEASASNSLSGPVGIAQVFGGSFDWANFWRIVGMLSMVLAFMNVLPIPALDGGHAIFLTYEMIVGRKPSDGFLENAQKVGMVLLLGLMVFAFGNDIYKLIF